MAMIIEFRGNGVRGEERAGDRKAHGEIIIFPGVRRERHADGEPMSAPQAEATAQPSQKPKRGRARPKRDRIELPD